MITRLVQSAGAPYGGDKQASSIKRLLQTCGISVAAAAGVIA